MEPLGQRAYTIIMWSTSMTAFAGDGDTLNIPISERLGGMAIAVADAADLDQAFFNRKTF